MDLELSAKQTAVVLIDLENGIVGWEPAPHAAACVQRGTDLSARMGWVRSTSESVAALKAYGRASKTRLKGVSVARRNWVKPACWTTSRICFSPA